MANYPINPYGQNAQMPEGYPIADNLNTNSAQQALSAKQGKKLGDFISTDANVDTSLIGEIVGVILGVDSSNPQGQWSNVWATNDSFKSKVVPVEPNKKYRITASKGNTYFAVLADDTLTNGATPSYATGTTQRTNLASGASAEVTTPANGNFICVTTEINGNKREPDIVKALNVDNSTLEEIIEDVAGSKGSSLLIAKSEFVVAAADAPAWQKVNADFQCDGVNDELTIQAAIDSLPEAGGRIRLTSGTFIIDSFPNDRAPSSSLVYVDQESGDSHRYAAIMLPWEYKHIIIEGDTFSAIKNKCTRLVVSDTCYGNIGENQQVVVIASKYPSNGIDQINNRNALTMTNICIDLPWNQKQIMCIDMLFTGRVDLKCIDCHAYINGSAHAEYTVSMNNPVPIAAQHCVGIRSTGGSNMGLCNDYRNLNMVGFYEGYKFSGEHVFGVHCGALMCYYGYTFGNFTYTHGCLHSIVLINSGDERCCCGPYFGNCTDRQQIDLLNWNNEVGASYIPGGVRIKEATEKVPGKFCGRIEYTRTKGDDNASPSVPWNSAVDSPFWERGHGHGFFTRNMFHKLACTTTERNTYAPDYMERIWDTTLGKEVICVDETNRVWKDAAGNTV
jgi:hypothetical protein